MLTHHWSDFKWINYCTKQCIDFVAASHLLTSSFAGTFQSSTNCPIKTRYTWCSTVHYFKKPTYSQICWPNIPYLSMPKSWLVIVNYRVWMRVSALLHHHLYLSSLFRFLFVFVEKNGAAWWWDGWPAVLATHKFRIGTFIITLHDLPVLSLVHGIAQTNWWSEIFIIPWRMAISLLTRALAALRHHRMDVPCACACSCALCIYYILGHNFNEMSTV